MVTTNFHSIPPTQFHTTTMFDTFFGIDWGFVWPVVFITTVVGGVIVYLLWCYINVRFQRYLREPPAGWQDYLEKASDIGAPLPSFGEKQHTIRRQLLKAEGTTPAKLSTNFVSLKCGKLPKNAFKAKYNDEGEMINRKTVFGFFHPFADAGGGGERVLWASVKQVLENDKQNVCVVYMSKSETELVDSGDVVMEKVEARFGLTMDKDRICFVFINYGWLVKASSWKRFTLIGQALGSVILAYQAIAQLVPDIFLDTAGYPFTYPIIDWLLGIPCYAYIHYPVVSSDMLKSTSYVSPKGWYWRLFKFCYGLMAKYCTLPVANSTWTKEHLKSVWGKFASRPDLITTVYPPCATQDFEKPDPEQLTRKRNVVYLGQFRPEKRHELVLREFAEFVKQDEKINDYTKVDKPHLVFIGSIRNDDDSQAVYSLRLLARELELGDDYVTFLLDAPWMTVQKILQYAHVGVNAMWNEHFGMVIVEYMCAGLIPICHASAGPKLDIIDEGETGFLFTSEEDPDYKSEEKHKCLSEQFNYVFNELTKQEMDKIRLDAFDSVCDRFSDAKFAKEFDIRVNILKKLDKIKRNRRLLGNQYD